MGSPSSIGSPITLNNLPRESFPTGTETGAPVSRTSTPLDKPSVGPRARHLAQELPTCCSTSKTNLSPSFSSSSA